MKTKTETYLSGHRAAVMLGVGPIGFIRMELDGIIKPHHKTLTGYARYTREEIERVRKEANGSR